MRRGLALTNSLKFRPKPKAKMPIPLSYFEKLTHLTSRQRAYLQEYQKRVSKKDGHTLEKIGTLLRKTDVKDSILDYPGQIETQYSDRHYRLHPEDDPKVKEQERLKESLKEVLKKKAE